MRPLPRPSSGTTCATAAGSRFASGSSSSSSSGSCRTARATARRWTIPRESSATGSSARACMPTASSTAWTRSAPSATRCRRAWKRRFSRPAQLAIQQRVVAEEADPPARGVAVVGQRAAEHAHLAGVRAQQRREHPQQRRLARAVGAEDDERLARGQLERHVAQRSALAVAAPGAAQADRWLWLRHGPDASGRARGRARPGDRLQAPPRGAPRAAHRAGPVQD